MPTIAKRRQSSQLGLARDEIHTGRRCKDLQADGYECRMNITLKAQLRILKCLGSILG